MILQVAKLGPAAELQGLSANVRFTAASSRCVKQLCSGAGSEADCKYPLDASHSLTLCSFVSAEKLQFLEGHVMKKNETVLWQRHGNCAAIPATHGSQVSQNK